jgi:hypothetical protein
MRPLILEFVQSEKRNNVEQILFEYNKELNLNVVKKVDNALIPFVEYSSQKFELATRTDIKSESPDDNINYNLQTQTRVMNEALDEINPELEMMTATAVKSEADEELNSLFLATLTKQNSEQSDDNDFDYN